MRLVCLSDPVGRLVERGNTDDQSVPNPGGEGVDLASVRAVQPATNQRCLDLGRVLFGLHLGPEADRSGSFGQVLESRRKYSRPRRTDNRITGPGAADTQSHFRDSENEPYISAQVATRRGNTQDCLKFGFGKPDEIRAVRNNLPHPTRERRALLDRVDHAEDRKVHRDDHSAHDRTENDDHDRLHCFQESLDRDVYFVIVEVGDL